MIDFQRIDLSDRQRIYDSFQRAGRESCSYSFANLYLWGKQVCAWVDGFLVVFSHYMGKSVYLFPAGEGDPAPVLKAMMEDAAHRGIPFRMTALSDEDCKAVERVFPGLFQFVPDKNAWDYLYEIDHLADLKGRGYQQKRNRINRFLEAAPNWRFAEIGPQDYELCRNMLLRWYESRLAADPTQDYHLEQNAAEKAMTNFEKLGLEGILLYDGDTPLGLTIGTFLTPTMFDIHFEKALGSVPGDYAMINRTYARHIREKYPQIRYLNREDDMGLPGLREAKQSYHPDRMVEQYNCFMKEDLNEN